MHTHRSTKQNVQNSTLTFPRAHIFHSSSPNTRMHAHTRSKVLSWICNLNLWTNYVISIPFNALSFIYSHSLSMCRCAHPVSSSIHKTLETNFKLHKYVWRVKYAHKLTQATRQILQIAQISNGKIHLNSSASTTIFESYFQRFDWPLFLNYIDTTLTSYWTVFSGPSKFWFYYVLNIK